jgi:hypothetical protein
MSPASKEERPQVRGLNLCLPACIFTLRDISMSCLVRNDHFCGSKRRYSINHFSFQATTEEALSPV